MLMYISIILPKNVCKRCSHTAKVNGIVYPLDFTIKSGIILEKSSRKENGN